MNIVDIALNPKCRDSITIWELARYILRVVKKVKQLPPKDSFFDSGPCPFPRPDNNILYFKESELCNAFCKEFDGHNLKGPTSEVRASFDPRFYEAMSLLKRRGLLMQYRESDHISLTSVGEESDFQDGILILIDSAQEILNSLKEQIPNLDPVVEQYYLHSLRSCQEGLYIASVICLGAASERIIDCLKDAIIDRYQQYKGSLGKKWTKDAVKQILRDFNCIFGQIIDRQTQVDLREQLELTEKIYRRNRNEAGHPKSVPMDITRSEQENYLNSFRRYAITIFKSIDKLKSAV